MLKEFKDLHKITLKKKKIYVCYLFIKLFICTLLIHITYVLYIICISEIKINDCE